MSTTKPFRAEPNDNGLNLPSYPAKVTLRSGKPFIYDCVRRKEVALTPEEWVRQHFIHWMTHSLGYPLIALGNEALLQDSLRRGRTDTLVFGTGGAVWMIIEFKAPEVPLTEKVWNQLSSYNVHYQAPFLVASNGITLIAAHIDYEQNRVTFLKEMPSWEQLRTTLRS